MINNSTTIVNNCGVSINHDADDSKAEILAKRILTIRDHWGIQRALKLYPYVDRKTLSKYEYV